jgi:hypothetical protein
MSDQRLHLATAAAFAVAVGLFVLAPAASSRSAEPQANLPPRLLVHVKARIRVYFSPAHPHNSMFADRIVTLKPSVVNVGTVIFDISNSDDESHRFEINGVNSKLIGIGGRATIRVTFKHAGIYPIAITTDTPIGFGGAMRVIK